MRIPSPIIDGKASATLIPVVSTPSLSKTILVFFGLFPVQSLSICNVYKLVEIFKNGKVIGTTVGIKVLDYLFYKLRAIA